MKWVISGDNHVRPYTWCDRRDIFGDAYYGFQQVVDIAIAEKADLILLGDVSDSAAPDGLTVNFLYRQFARLAVADRRCYFIQGNHDYCPQAVTGWPAAWCALGAVHVHKKRLPVGADGLDYTPRSKLQASLSEVTTSVLLAHQSWQELQKVGDADASLEWLPPCVTTLLTGDLHKHFVEEMTVLGRQITVVSPGSTFQNNIAENDRKAVIVAEGDSLAVANYRSVPLKGRRFHNFVLENERDLASLEKDFQAVRDPDLPENLRTPLVRIRYPYDLPDVHARLTAAAKVLDFHLFVDPIRPEQREVEVLVPEEDGDVDLLRIVEAMRGGKDSVYEDVSRLYRSNDWAKELDQMEKEAMSSCN